MFVVHPAWTGLEQERFGYTICEAIALRAGYLLRPSCWLPQLFSTQGSRRVRDQTDPSRQTCAVLCGLQQGQKLRPTFEKMLDLPRGLLSLSHPIQKYNIFYHFFFNLDWSFWFLSVRIFTFCTLTLPNLILWCRQAFQNIVPVILHNPPRSVSFLWSEADGNDSVVDLKAAISRKVTSKWE